MTSQPPPAAEALSETPPISEPVREERRSLADMFVSAPQPRNADPAFAQLSVLLHRTERRISVCGELDIASVSVLAEAMALLIGVNPGDSTIDLGGVSFIDATGLGCLVGFANQLAVSGAKMSVVGAAPRLRRVFELAQLGGMLQAA